jgi:hypothetical protein
VCIRTYTPSLVVASDASGNPNFYTSLYDAVSTDWNIVGDGGVRGFLQKITTGELGAEWLSDMIVNIIIKAVIPILALVGIVLAVIGFFKLMSSTDEAELKKWRNFLLRGVVGTLIMVSAARVVIQLVEADGAWWILGEISRGWSEEASGAQVASDIYRKIAYPLIRVILNIIIGLLFLIAVGQWFKYLFSGDDEAQKKAFWILIYTVVGILIIILAKTIVEAIYGQYDQVVSGEALSVTPGGEDLWSIGDGVFEDPEIDMVYTVINRFLWLATFIVTIIIIYIGYLLLVQPTSEETATKLKNAITRALAGILLIWVAYLIANFLIIK